MSLVMSLTTCSKPEREVWTNASFRRVHMCWRTFVLFFVRELPLGIWFFNCVSTAAPFQTREHEQKKNSSIVLYNTIINIMKYIERFVTRHKSIFTNSRVINRMKHLHDLSSTPGSVCIPFIYKCKVDTKSITSLIVRMLMWLQSYFTAQVFIWEKVPNYHSLNYRWNHKIIHKLIVPFYHSSVFYEILSRPYQN